MGGAEVVNLEKRIGNFVVGKEFDALLIRTGLSPTVDDVIDGVVDVDVDGEEDEEDEDDVEEEWENPKKLDGNPGMIVEEDDSIEMMFEKVRLSCRLSIDRARKQLTQSQILQFLFTVRPPLRVSTQ